MKTKLSLMAVFAASTALAQEVVDLPELSFSANFDEVELTDTGVQVVVIEGEEISRLGTQPMAEVLGSQSGVSITRNGPVGGNTSVSIRGTRGYESKVFVDGIDVTDPSLTQSFYNFGTMTMGTFERVEIVKGSQSAIYGSNAVGGVIDITTQGATRDGFSGQASVEAGEYDSLSQSFTIAHAGAKHELALSYSGISTQGFSAYDYDNKKPEADDHNGYRWALKGSYDITDAITVGGSLFTAYSEGNYDLPFFGLDNDNLSSIDELGGRIYGRFKTDRMSHELSYSQYDISRKYEDYRDFLFFEANYRYDGARSGFSYAGDYELMDNLSANLRLEQTEESYEQLGDYGVAKETAVNRGVALGLDYSPIEALNLNLAARYDEHEIYGENTSYRLAGAYEIVDGLTAKASYGTGFRAPSLYEANYNATKDLEAETSESYDIGIEYRKSNAMIGATYFDIKTDNRIDYNDNGTVFPIDFTGEDDFYENVKGETKRSGYEIYGEYAVNDNFSVNASYTHVETEDPDGERLVRVPTDEYGLGLNASYGLVSFDADVKSVADTLDRFREELDDYMIVNARLGVKLGTGELYVRGENLFDEDYETVRGYNTSGAAYYAGYQVQF